MEHKTTYLNLVNKTLGCALHPRGLLRLRELFVTNEMVPTLAPHVNMLATILGTALDFLYLIVGGRPGLFALRITSSRGHRCYRTKNLARGALWRRSLHSGWSRAPPPFRRWGSRSSVLLLRDTARGRRPRRLIIPCRGARSGPRWSRMLLGTLSRGRHCGLLLGLLLGGPQRCVPDDSRRLGCPLARDVVGIDVGRRTNRNMAFYLCQTLR